MISKAIILLLILSGVTSASVWIGDKEVGLAAYQDKGYVSGTPIARELSSNLDYVYMPVSYMPDKYLIDAGIMKITFVSRLS